MQTMFRNEFIASPEETQEQVQDRVNKLTQLAFMNLVVAASYSTASCGVTAFMDGNATPNGKTHLAIARRIAREHGIDNAGSDQLYQVQVHEEKARYERQMVADSGSY